MYKIWIWQAIWEQVLCNSGSESPLSQYRHETKFLSYVLKCYGHGGSQKPQFMNFSFFVAIILVDSVSVLWSLVQWVQLCTDKTRVTRSLAEAGGGRKWQSHLSTWRAGSVIVCSPQHVFRTYHCAIVKPWPHRGSPSSSVCAVHCSRDASGSLARS